MIRTLVILLLLSWRPLSAQRVDTLLSSHDRNPKKAMLLSAILPGLGQAYNRRYWKIPIVWAGIGFTSYLIVKNKREYARFDRAYRARYDDDPNTIDTEFPRYSNEAIYRIRQAYDKNVQLAWIWTGAVYVLNIADAFVDAHLSSFDVSDDLSLRWHPVITNGTAPGLAFNLHF